MNSTSHLLKHEILSKNETRNLIKKYQDGDTLAKDKIIKHNLRFVYGLAKKWGKGNRFLTEEYFSEGVIGLLKALNNFDLSYDVEFITYAIYWVNQAIYRYAIKQPFIHIPQRVGVQLRKLKRLSYDQHIPLMDLIENDPMRDILLKAEIVYSVSSLNSKIKSSEDDSLELIDVTVDEKYDVEDNVLNSIFCEKINNELKHTLSDKEYFIIKKRMEGVTLKTIGKKINMSTENVRQMEIKIKRKLKRSVILQSIYNT